MTLEDDTFLNDIIIDFYLMYLYDAFVSPAEKRSLVRFFLFPVKTVVASLTRFYLG